MRVTENTNFDTVRDSIRRSRDRMEGLQRQSATLKKVNTPSDDPIGSAKILEIRTEKVNNDQFQMNAKMAETFLNNSDHAMEVLANIVLRAKEIAIGQSSGASSNEETRLGIAEEVAQLYQQAVATANFRVGDRYLFGGYRTNHPPVSQEGDYQGDQGQMMVEVAKDVYIGMNVPGVELFNTELQTLNSEELQPNNVNLFNELQNFRIALLTSDLDAIRDTLDKFDQLHGKIIVSRAKVGSRLQGLQSTMNALEKHNLTNAHLSSLLEDADMSQVVSDLAKEETVFRSALASSQKLIQPTLMDFLK